MISLASWTGKRRASHTLEALKRSCDEVAQMNPADTHKMAAMLSEMSLNYYQDVRHQAQQSFMAAIGAALLGTGLFLYAAWSAMGGAAKVEATFVSLIGGAVIQVISGINFYLYNRAARQFAMFHICLERTNRFLLANTLCENMEDPIRKDCMRGELVRVVAYAPMLTLDMTSRKYKLNSEAPLQSTEMATGVPGS